MKIKQQIQDKINNTGAKNIFKTLSGAVLITLVFILNGFLSFVVVGFEWSRIWTSQYWANFGLTTASELLVMYGMFLIQRTKDLGNKKVTSLQDEIDKKREIIYGLDKVSEAEDWLREIYNYKQRLLIYERKIKSIYDNIKAIEPQKKEKGNNKDYERKYQKYLKLLQKKKFLQKQLEFIKKDKKRILLATRNAPVEEIEKIEKEINTDEYLFKTIKIRYKEVYWGNLLSGIEAQGNKDTTPFFDEKKEVSKTAAMTIGIGCIVSAFMTALTTSGINSTGWSFWLDIVLKSIILITFLVRGFILSKSIILDKFYKALEKRKSIYVAMLKDLGLSKIIFEGDESEQKSN